MTTDWDRLQERLLKLDFASSPLLLGLDFDGTLAELAAVPDQARLRHETRSALRALARRPDTKVAVLSGRSLADVRERVSLPGLYYAGSHGLEIHGPDLRWTHPEASAVSAAVFRDLDRELARFRGASLERKPLGLTVHYRGVPARDARRLRERVRDKIAAVQDRFRVLRGKQALDLRPRLPWDKGHALETIRRTLNGGWLAMFIGDDRTDEEGFRTLGPRALTVRVGRVRRSDAEYVLTHRRRVDRLLEWLARRPAAA